MTLKEAWSGGKPSADHFRIFGCVGHVHVPNAKRTKLDDKSVKCIFLGFNSESKAFRMFDPIEKKIYISRDVYLKKIKAWNWDVGCIAKQSI